MLVHRLVEAAKFNIGLFCTYLGRETESTTPNLLFNWKLALGFGGETKCMYTILPEFLMIALLVGNILFNGLIIFTKLLEWFVVRLFVVGHLTWLPFMFMFVQRNRTNCLRLLLLAIQVAWIYVNCFILFYLQYLGQNMWYFC